MLSTGTEYFVWLTIYYLSSPIGQIVMDGNGVDSIGTCHTAVITGFASHPFKHSLIPRLDKINPATMINSQRTLPITLREVPRTDIPCNVDVLEYVFHKSSNDRWEMIKSSVVSVGN